MIVMTEEFRESQRESGRLLAHAFMLEIAAQPDRKEAIDRALAAIRKFARLAIEHGCIERKIPVAYRDEHIRETLDLIAEGFNARIGQILQAGSGEGRA